MKDLDQKKVKAGQQTKTKTLRCATPGKSTVLYFQFQQDEKSGIQGWRQHWLDAQTGVSASCLKVSPQHLRSKHNTHGRGIFCSVRLVLVPYT